MIKIDNRPIGVFDSGLGGLTTVRKLMEVLPNENIVYLGDTGRVPYGGKSRETIIKYAKQDMAFLLKHNVKTAVIACGTVSTNAQEIIADDYDIPVFGVVNPAVSAAVRLTKNRRIGLIGTAASIRSGSYERMIRSVMPDAEIVSRPCPLFVPLVENGRFTSGDPVIETIAREYLQPMIEAGVDTLILGCTHYPLLAGIISDIMGPDVALVDVGAATAVELSAVLKENDLLSDSSTMGECSYYVTDRVEGFSRMASLFLQKDIDTDVQQITLDAF